MTYQSLLILALGFVFSIAVAWGLNAYVARRKQGLFTVLNEKVSLKSPEDIRHFGRVDGLARLVFLLLAICAGCAAYVVLRAFSHLRVMMLPAAMMTVAGDGVVLIFIAGVVGAGIATATFIPVMRHWWPEDTKWYLAYMSLRDRSGGYERSYRVYGSVIVVIALMPFPWALNWYVQARDIGLIVHPFFAVHEQLYRYSDIQSIEIVAVRNRYGYQDRYFLSFKDGRMLEPCNDFPVSGGSGYTPLIQLLSRRSGVPVKRH